MKTDIIIYDIIRAYETRPDVPVNIPGDISKLFNDVFINGKFDVPDS